MARTPTRRSADCKPVQGDVDLLVHTWTFRNDASGYGFADPKAEMAYFVRLGVDGAFTDFPDTGVAAVTGALP